jgi:pimeloyl-ACP methyl ester carboxylesterase
MCQWPVPYDDMYVSTTFGNTHVVASGPLDADSVVLLNPGGGSATIWSRNIEPLSQRYRTYAVDVMGEMNKSEPTRPIRNHRDFRQWMTDLLDGLEIQSTHIIGNSNGGFFTLETAYLLPGRTKKIVLISPPGGHLCANVGLVVSPAHPCAHNRPALAFRAHGTAGL